MAMKLNYTLNLCYIFCLGIALAILPVKRPAMSELAVSNSHKTIAKLDKPIVPEDQDILHGDLLFK